MPSNRALEVRRLTLHFVSRAGRKICATTSPPAPFPNSPLAAFPGWLETATSLQDRLNQYPL